MAIIDPVRNPPPPPCTLDERGLPVGTVLRTGWEVSPRQAAEQLKTSAPILLDCRRDEEWAFNRLTGAIHIPMSAIEARLDELERTPGDRSTPIIVYCHHGVRSMRVTAALRAHGFADVTSMAGGIDLWSMAVDSSIPRY
jgi:adenylyltransferase/sulfurtransferase